MAEPLSMKTKNLVKLGYLLQMLGVLFFITAVIGVLINHSRFEELRGTNAESHIRWQILTFWASAFVAVLAVMLIHHTVGQYLLISTAIWFYYRVLKGFWALHKNRPAPKF